VTVPTENGIFGGARFVPAYGWDRIKKLAKLKPYVDTQDIKGPDNNADSIAYFALGCWLMSRPQEPKTIDNMGNIVKIEQPVVFPPPLRK